MYNINTYLYLRDKLKNQLVLSQFKPQIFSPKKMKIVNQIHYFRSSSKLNSFVNRSDSNLQHSKVCK